MNNMKKILNNRLIGIILKINRVLGRLWLLPERTESYTPNFPSLTFFK